MSRHNAALAVDARCTLGEGLLWDARDQSLLWTDIDGRCLWRHDPVADSTESWPLPDRAGAFTLCASGSMLIGLTKGLYRAERDRRDGRPLDLILVAHVEAGVPTTRINDGRTDRAGNFVFGTYNEAPDEAALGHFYQYSSSHGLRRLALDPVVISNSICFSPDGATMYYCDTLARCIMQCDYDAASATVERAREFARMDADQGLPDGSVIDSEGCLWNAEWGGAAVTRYSPDGTRLTRVPVPAPNITCPVFGGRDLDELFVTSSRNMMSAEQLASTPHAGGLFRARIDGVRGLADVLFVD